MQNFKVKEVKKCFSNFLKLKIKTKKFQRKEKEFNGKRKN